MLTTNSIFLNFIFSPGIIPIREGLKKIKFSIKGRLDGWLFKKLKNFIKHLKGQVRKLGQDETI